MHCSFSGRAFASTVKIFVLLIKSQDNILGSSLFRDTEKVIWALWAVALYQWLHITTREVLSPLVQRNLHSMMVPQSEHCNSARLTVTRERVLGIFSSVGTFWAQDKHRKWRRSRNVGSSQLEKGPARGLCPQVPAGPVFSSSSWWPTARSGTAGTFTLSLITGTDCQRSGQLVTGAVCRVPEREDAQEADATRGPPRPSGWLTPSELGLSLSESQVWHTQVLGFPRGTLYP